MCHFVFRTILGSFVSNVSAACFFMRSMFLLIVMTIIIIVEEAQASLGWIFIQKLLSASLLVCLCTQKPTQVLAPQCSLGSSAFPSPCPCCGCCIKFIMLPKENLCRSLTALLWGHAAAAICLAGAGKTQDLMRHCCEVSVLLVAAVPVVPGAGL